MEEKLILRAITPEDEGLVMPMVAEFYQSSAVDHPVEESVLKKSFTAVVQAEEGNIHGFLLKVGDDVIGYAYLTSLFSCEVGGLCIFLEEIYVKEGFQGKGYGRKALSEILAHYPEAKRFRLEVTPSNQGAKRLYESLGFEMLPYEQMVLEVEEKTKVDYVAKVKEIRGDRLHHKNCNQAVLLTFQEEMGLSDVQLEGFGAHFGLGMGHKYTCGAVTGGLMALGAMGYGKAEAQGLMEDFLAQHESHECDTLLKARAQGGATCDELIVSVVEYVGKLQHSKEEQ
ncbi:MAG: C-GCAxxG-C-C family (seleno)protein [Eubacteriales bacterium]